MIHTLLADCIGLPKLLTSVSKLQFRSLANLIDEMHTHAYSCWILADLKDSDYTACTTAASCTVKLLDSITCLNLSQTFGKFTQFGLLHACMQEQLDRTERYRSKITSQQTAVIPKLP